MEVPKPQTIFQAGKWVVNIAPGPRCNEIYKQLLAMFQEVNMWNMDQDRLELTQAVLADLFFALSKTPEKPDPIPLAEAWLKDDIPWSQHYHRLHDHLQSLADADELRVQAPGE